MATPAIRIYDALKPIMGEENTKEFIVALDESIVAKIEFMKHDLATKKDIDELRLATKENIDELRSATKKDIDELRLATKKDIDELRSATKKDIDELRLATKENIDELRSATKKDFEELRSVTQNEFITVRRDLSELKEDFYALLTKMLEFKLEIKSDLGKMRVENLRNAQIMTLVQLIAIIGSLLTILKVIK